MQWRIDVGIEAERFPALLTT